MAAAGAWRRAAGSSALELDGEGSALFGSAARPGRTALGGARVERRLGASAGSRMRGSGHLAWRGAGLLTGRALDAGAWWRGAGRAVVTARVERMWAEGQLFEGDDRDRVLAVVPVRYTEGLATLTLTEECGSLQVGAGARRDPDAPQRVEARWQLGATARPRAPAPRCCCRPSAHRRTSRAAPTAPRRSAPACGGRARAASHPWRHRACQGAAPS
jgi:hypothetical protein